MAPTVRKLFTAAMLSAGMLFAATTGWSQMRGGSPMGAPPPGGMNQPGMAQPGMPQPGAAGLQGMQNSAMASFAADVRRNNKAETDLSKLALKNSSNDDVKKLAQQVIEENRRSATALAGAMSEQNQSEMMFASPVPSQTREAEKQMKKLNGTPFDQMYLSQMDGYVKNDQKLANDAWGMTNSGDLGSLSMQLRNTADQRATQIAQVAQGENFKIR
jgi:predicted outer membrane protein